MEKKFDGNYTIMLRAILNKSRRQHPIKEQLYGHFTPITKTIKVRRTRHVGHCWRSRDELISDILLLIPSHGRAKAWRPARTYIQQLCASTGYSLEDDRDGWRERVTEIRTGSATWWGWWYVISAWFNCKLWNINEIEWMSQWKRKRNRYIYLILNCINFLFDSQNVSWNEKK